MALYAIGDLHLSHSTNKPMNIFGAKWENHEQKLVSGFSGLGPEDVTVLCGDLSWGMDLEECLEDFRFIARLPGKKILLKGNHDYWWSTVTKAKNFFEKHDILDLDILNNNCFFYGETAAICGTRGWFYEEDSGTEHDKKIMNRELMRLEVSLQAAGDREKYVFLHYPPVYAAYVCEEILELFRKYQVRLCCAGHIHGKGLANVFEGRRDYTLHKMVSADFLDFIPYKILP